MPYWLIAGIVAAAATSPFSESSVLNIAVGTGVAVGLWLFCWAIRKDDQPKPPKRS